MAERLASKVAIVTGSGSAADPDALGIGQAIAVSFAREGASVLVVDRDGERAANTVGQIERAGGRAAPFVGDITNAAACQAMVGSAVERFGGVDILVNNAAIAHHATITDTPEEVYDDVLAVNLKGTFLASKYAMPALVERGGGSIVNIGSIASTRYAGTGESAYAASKAGQLGLTVELAGTYGRDNVRVNAVLPGIIATPMLQSVGRIGELGSKLNLLGRMGNAWDIANAVVFLCSDEGAYITGVILPVDGGATMAMQGAAFRRT